MSQRREFPSGVACGGKVLFAGGLALFNPPQVYNRVDIWDVAAGTWSQASLSVARFSASTATDGRYALFAGGASPAANYSAVDIYDSQTGNWTTANLSQSRAALGAAVANGKAYFGGGFRVVAGGVSKRVDIYDFATGNWTVDSLSQARAFVAAVTAGSKVIFAGGITASNTPSNMVDIYDTQSGVWSTAQLSEARAFLFNHAASACNKAFFIAGGDFDLNTQGWQSASRRVDVYDAATTMWMHDSLPAGLIDHAVTALGDQVFVAGGVYLDPVPPYVNDSVTSMVRIFSCTATGIEKEDIVMGETLTVYPNPNAGRFSVKAPGAASAPAELEIYDLQGRKVFTQSFRGESTEVHAMLAPGLYFCRVSRGNAVTSQRVWIQ